MPSKPRLYTNHKYHLIAKDIILVYVKELDAWCKITEIPKDLPECTFSHSKICKTRKLAFEELRQLGDGFYLADIAKNKQTGKNQILSTWEI